jgi:hypothetical protein
MRKLGLVLPVAALFAFGCGGDDDDDAGGIDAGGGIDAAAGTTLTAALTAAAEGPTPCAAAGAAATGSATITINAAMTDVAVNLTFSGLSGPATLAHIHTGAAGANGMPAFAFAMNPTSPVVKTFVAADYAMPPGGPANFAAFLTAMAAGQAYVNVHTTACPSGEIRGQIQ